ncbi:Nose resistant to fluoxetine protein 6 [Araneus ventricosus]|uniref:Nose resistant to fluoxetine protein 6 n=1 Tax=Araneus ventricosus TaxID=182803 RepID=A0A4Y2I9V6_ARAVE|nr:Nose resistant to fluoxetine protein 6 [Araneus ventricosus]
MLAFFGLATLGTSITAYEFYFKDNEKKSAPRKNPYNEKIAKSTLKALEESKLSAGHDFLENCKSFLKCFCIVKNGSKILSTASIEGQIGCFQGLRVFSNVSIMCVHIGFAYISVLRHVKEIKFFLDLRASHLALNGTFAVDVFFVISGFLNANAFLHKYIKSNGNISWFYFYFKRFARLTPVYMIVLGFNATLFAYTGTGTLWPTYDTNPVCHKDWWWHLLYINNFENSDKQCMVWCWYLAADMQFYIISPLFMVPLIRWPRLGYALIFACISGSCVASFLLTYQYNLIDGFSRFEFHLDDSQNFMIKLWKYFDLVYTKPYTRIGPYFVAILLAYYLHKKSLNKGTTKNSAVTLSCGWIVTALFIWVCFFSLYKKEEIIMVTALYNGTKSLLYSCSLAWMIYLCLTGQSEFLNKCLSWKYFLPLSRLSYCAYLIHPLILAKLFLEAHDLMDFSYTSMIWFPLYVCGITYAVSFIVSMLFEIPVLNLLDWLGKKKVEKDSNVSHLD